MDYKTLTGGTVGTGLSLLGTSMATDRIEAIVGIVCSIIGVVITVISGLIIPLIKNIKKAKEDGEITGDEVSQIVSDAKEGAEQVVDKIKEEIDKHKEDKDE